MLRSPPSSPQLASTGRKMTHSTLPPTHPTLQQAPQQQPTAQQILQQPLPQQILQQPLVQQPQVQQQQLQQPQVQQPPSLQPPQRKNTRTSLCKICSRQHGNAGIINCFECNSLFHRSCAGVSDEFYDYYILTEGCPWFCHYCEISKLQDVDLLSATIENAKSEILNTVGTQFETLRASIFSNKQEIEHKIKKLESNLRSEMELIKANNPSNTKVDDSTETRINFLESQLKKKNVIISNIPEQENENLKRIIVRIGQACSIIISENDIEEVVRLRSKPIHNPQPSTSGQRSTPILVKFYLEATKNQLFDGYINLIHNKMFLKCNAIGMNSEKRIYINHHLGPALRKIQEKALHLQKANILEKVNANYNGISVKMDGKWKSIATLNQLDILIKTKKSPA